MSDNFDLLASLPLPAYITDLEGRILRYNSAAVDLWGRAPEVGVDRLCGSHRLFDEHGNPVTESEHPLARMLQNRAPAAPAELIAERPDGVRVPFVAHPSFVQGDGGEVSGVVVVLVRTYDATHHALELERLAAIVASTDDAIISKGLDGRITSWNESAERIFGYQPEEMIGQPILRLIPPELHKEEEEIITRLRRGERIEHYDTTRVRKDGSRIDVSITVSPLRDRSGTIVGASKVARDVTERKQAEELQELLFHELNHRVKNTLATVQAIASQSLRLSSSPARFVEGFSGRLKAIGAAQSLLVQKEMTGADISELIRDHVTLGDDATGRISAFGPSITLSPKITVQLALVLHELATNARKYGALSVPTGRLRISWSISTEDADNLDMTWIESGVAEISAPTQKGFGTTLITQSLHSCGGSASIEYTNDGLICLLSLPLESEGRNTLGTWSREPQPSSRVSVNHRLMNLNGTSILVVEDEALIAMEMEDELERQGANVTWAPDVDSALRALDQQYFDGAVLDGNLRGESVEPVALQLEMKGVPFVFGTGYGSQALPQRFRHVPILMKPFDPSTMVSALQTRLWDSRFYAGQSSRRPVET